MKEFIPSQEYLDSLEHRQIKEAGNMIVAANHRNHNAIRAILDSNKHKLAQIAAIQATGPAQRAHWEAKLPEVKAELRAALLRVLHGQPRE
jgi:hypothetical protein